MENARPQLAYRGRLAPSPTGFLHLGHARTFWVASERARRAGGALILRMEDLDPQRSRQEYADSFAEDLHWLGIEWQEGPECGGPCAPYCQSQRRELYLQAWQKLLDMDAIYPCRCSRRELRESSSAPHEDDDEPLYPGTCRQHRLPAKPTAPAGWNWRFRVPDGEAVEFHDAQQGRQCYVAGRDFGDFVLWRRDDVPSYQLAVVVDDAAMGITEVVRGADLLRSTARQILLQRALGLPTPAYFHCDLLTDAQGVRLAKRNAALSLRELRRAGLSMEPYWREWRNGFFPVTP
jgi:glutamyl-tRNA synthetase